VTAGFNCIQSLFPNIVFDSGIRPADSTYSKSRPTPTICILISFFFAVLNITSGNGFARGNTYTFYTKSCETTGMFVNGQIYISQKSTYDDTIGVAIGLSVGMFAICLVVLVLSKYFSNRKYKLH
jgi:hypothetical protein